MASGQKSVRGEWNESRNDGVVLTSFMHISPRPDVIRRKSHARARMKPPAKAAASAGLYRCAKYQSSRRHGKVGERTMSIDRGYRDERKREQSIHDRIKDIYLISLSITLFLLSPLLPRLASIIDVPGKNLGFLTEFL